MADPITQIIRDAGGIVHSDGNIFFTNHYQFQHAASLVCGVATVAVPQAAQPAQQAPQGARMLTDEEATATLKFGASSYAMASVVIAKFCEVNGIALPPAAQGEKKQ